MHPVSSIVSGHSCLRYGTDPREENGAMVVVEPAPLRELFEGVGKGPVLWNQNPVNFLLIEHILPTRLDVFHPEVIANKGYAVEVVAVVHENLVPGPETVNKISAPVVGIEDLGADALGSEEIGRRHGKALPIEVSVHQRARPQAATVQANHKGDDHRHHREQVATQAKFGARHASGEILPAQK